jgi:CO/xanthine dehydrogenase Mo-binding subunit
MASEKLGASPGSMFVKDGVVHVKMGDKSTKIAELFTPMRYLIGGGEILASATYSCPLGSEDADTGQGKRPVTYYAHGANAVEVVVNGETGEVRVVAGGVKFRYGPAHKPKIL